MIRPREHLLSGLFSRDSLHGVASYFDTGPVVTGEDALV
jgi:hypothetical protein